MNHLTPEQEKELDRAIALATSAIDGVEVVLVDDLEPIARRVLADDEGVSGIDMKRLAGAVLCWATRHRLEVMKAVFTGEIDVDDLIDPT